MKTFGKYFSVGVIALTAGLFLGVNYHEPIKASPISFIQASANEDIRETPDGATHFTSPLLECAELPESVSDSALNAAKAGVQDFITAQKANGDVSEVSVYFRDLNNGPWFGINESNNYFPASLLKLPLAMAYYQRAENDPSLLAKELVYTPDPSITSQLQPFGNQEQLVAGKRYTVQKLLDLMLTESNNEAANTLAVAGGTSTVDSVYHDLGLTVPTPGQDYSINTHQYASFFRILYNATYISRASSESILKTLGNTTFQAGLSAGVPQSVNVSDKFGTRQVDNSGTVQLHDCGIVYAPKKPYVLCVMTQGADFNKLADVIKNISTVVYSNVTASTNAMNTP
jgi:beta-lactamase class A